MDPDAGVVRLLEAARRRLMRCGWARGRWRDPDGAVCLAQALLDEVHDGAASMADLLRAEHRLQAVLGAEAGGLEGALAALVAFNDLAATTLADVVGALMRAAEGVRRVTAVSADLEAVA